MEELKEVAPAIFDGPTTSTFITQKALQHGYNALDKTIQVIKKAKSQTGPNSDIMALLEQDKTFENR